MATRKSVRMAFVAAGMAAALAGGITGCSSLSELTAAGQVSHAFTALEDQPGFTATLSIGVTPAQWRKLSSGDVSGPVAGLLSSGRIAFTVHTGHGETLADAGKTKDTDTQVEVTLQADGKTRVDIRVVGGKIYARADIDGLLTAAGVSASQRAGVAKELQQLKKLPGLAPLATGGWVSLDLAQLKPLLNQAQKQVPSTKTDQHTASMLEQILARDVTVTKVGSGSAGTEYRVTAPVRELLNDFVKAVQPALAQTKGANLGDLTSDLGKIPKGLKATVTVFVQQGRLSEIDLDLNQFAPASEKASFAIPVRLTFRSAGAVPAPAGASTVNIQKIVKALQSEQAKPTGSTTVPD